MRNYGQDSILTNKKDSKNDEISFKKRVRFYFDNAISKTKYFILFLLLISFLLGLLMTIVHYSVDQSKDGSFFDNWWTSITTILGIGSGTNWTDRTINFLYWSFSVAISGSIIGFIAKGISNLVEQLKKGKSQVICNNHILILGWSNSIFSILKELSIANQNVKNAVVIIFSELDNEKMLDEIASKVNVKLNLKIITRSGDTANPIELKMANPTGAKNIIILGQDKNSDTKVITTILALHSMLKNTKVSIIAQINDSKYVKNISQIKNVNVIPVLSKNIITNVTAQTLRQNGIGTVILDLLDFDGDEIYFSEIPQLIGKTYLEALISFEDSSVMGIIDENNQIQLNPENETIINIGDKLIVISKDDDTIIYAEDQITPKNEIKTPENLAEKKENNILFIGWSAIGNDILASLTPFLNATSKITVLFLPEFVNQSYISNNIFNNIKIDFIPVSGSDFNFEKFIVNGQFKEIMIIGYTDMLSIPEADTLTLLEMLKLDNIKQNHLASEFRVIAEILDSSKAKLAEFTETEELIISDNLVALLMSQLTENPDLNFVFNDLFDAEGASINMLPIERYIELNKEISFADLVYTAGKKNQSVIGIKVDNEKVSNHTEGVFLNPNKKMKITPKSGDQLIVISSSID
jgi:Trk K+ transport system NAD-binding subunit